MLTTHTTVLLAVSLLSTLVYTCSLNSYSKGYAAAPASFQFYNLCASLVSALVLLATGGWTGGTSPYTLLLGTVFGTVTALSAVFNLKALHIGPMSYTTVLVTSSMLVPTLAGRIGWGEQVSFLQYTGIVLMLISIALSTDKHKGNNTVSARWLAYCMAAFAMTGMIGVLQKIHQTSPYRDEAGAFLVVAFLVSALFSAVPCLRGRKELSQSHIFSSRPILLLLAGGLGTVGANKLNLYLSGVMESAVFFPIVNGGSLLLAVLAALLLYREKLPGRKWAGLAVGIAGIFLLYIKTAA